MNDLQLGFEYLVQLSIQGILAVFWYTLIFEIPRYSIPFVAAGLSQRGTQDREPSKDPQPSLNKTVSVVLVGHNEELSLESCVRSLREQSLSDFEIVIVSDGSSDGMVAISRDLVKQGLATRVLTTDLRGGKSSGINLAINHSKGDIIVNVDCDCSFDRYCLEELLRQFDDPRVGAACGDIVPRNGDATLITQFQEIEYLQAISVGKRIGDVMDQVVCASGALGAFRRDALEQVGLFDVGGGEDLDITIRLRQRGWRIAYAQNAICYTDVPETAFQYIRQRLRWERDAIWLRFRKHKKLLSPAYRNFRLAEAFHQWDFLLFNVVGAFVFPAYLIWLAVLMGSLTIPILISMQIGLLVLDIITLAFAAWTTQRPVFWRNLLFLPGYSIFMTYVMRPVRLIAYIEEWAFSGSQRDNYTPLKVRHERAW